MAIDGYIIKMDYTQRKKLAAAVSRVASNISQIYRRILSLNGDNHETICERLNVPTTHEAVAVLLLGYSAEDTTDATSSASVRNDMADKVSIIK